MGRLSAWYDEEGDFLEVTVDHEMGGFTDLGDGVFERVDEDGNTLGFAILNAATAEHEIPADLDEVRASIPTTDADS